MTTEAEHVPSWLTAAMDQKLQLVKTGVGVLGTGAADDFCHTFAFLTEPEPGAGEEGMRRWNHSCDNCQQEHPEGLVHGHMEFASADGRRTITITFACCQACRALP